MRRAFAAALAAMTLVAAGCSSAADKKPDTYSADPKVLNIVMGSEQHLVFEQIVATLALPVSTTSRIWRIEVSLPGVNPSLSMTGRQPAKTIGEENIGLGSTK